jgi:hypothetical protein
MVQLGAHLAVQRGAPILSGGDVLRITDGREVLWIFNDGG